MTADRIAEIRAKIPVHPAPSSRLACTHWCVMVDGVPLVALQSVGQALDLAAHLRYCFEYTRLCARWAAGRTWRAESKRSTRPSTIA